ncbi:hypothetical protein ACVI1L_004661 [Bradyrhizobium sp. USDA 4516]|nr:hypothetical protein [Bradyrhizobium sp. USDA 4541]
MDMLAFCEKQMLASPSDLPLKFHPAAVRYAKWLAVRLKFGLEN